MFDPTDAPHKTVLQLLTGHFREAPGYRAFRKEGVQDWLVIYTASGHGRFGHPEGEFVSNSGDWVLLRPGTRHDYGVDGSASHWELTWAHFQPRPDWQKLLSWPSICKGLMRLTITEPDCSSIADRFLEVHAMRDGAPPHRDMAAMNALEDVFLQCDRHNKRTRRGDERISKAMDYMERHLDRKLSLHEIAANANLSISRLAHLFSAEAGQAPQRYLETLRMKRAADLLERTSFSVKQIAGMVGYENALYFSIRFKNFTQTSPTEYRQRNTIRRI